MEKLTIRSWNVVGPFGFPELATWDSRAQRDDIIKKIGQTSYSPEKALDLTATYAGDETITRQKNRPLKWKTVNIGDEMVDIEPVLGWKAGEDAGTVFLATHIYAPAATDVRLETLDEHGLHFIRGWLNGEAIPGAKKQNPRDIRLDGEKPIALRAGWNELLVRYDRIYGRDGIGLRLLAAPAELWKLKISAAKP